MFWFGPDLDDLMVSELPHDLVVIGIDFDHEIIELVGDNDIALGIEPFSLCMKRKAEREYGARDERKDFYAAWEFHRTLPRVHSTRGQG